MLRLVTDATPRHTACALPYTPVPGPRLGAQPAQAAAALRQQCTEGGESGAHVLFLPEAEAQAVLARNYVGLPY